MALSVDADRSSIFTKAADGEQAANTKNQAKRPAITDGFNFQAARGRRYICVRSDALR